MAANQSTTIVPMVVYALADSGAPDAIRYVGKSSAARLQARFAQHLRSSRRGCRTYKARWVRAVLAAGRQILCVVLAEVATEHEAFELERATIARMRAAGAPLTNITDGGEGSGGLRWSDASRQRASRERRGRVTSEETKQKLSAALRGLTRSAETKRKMSEAAKNRSRDCYAASTAASRGRKHTPEARARMSASHTGKPLSDAHRAGMVAGHRARKEARVGSRKSETA